MTGFSGPRVEETAYAKLNLYLHVTAIRPDGYHDLDSLFVFTDFGDTLSFTPAGDLSLALSGPFGEYLPADEDNLVLRAARALRDEAGVSSSGAHITLEKNLPVASGIGGGSADAAAALRGLNRLWGRPLEYQDLERIAARLGADIPACLRSTSLQVSGIGDVMVDAEPHPACSVVLVNPGVAIPTPSVFRSFDEDPVFRPPAPLSTQRSRAGWIKALMDRHNDLTGAAAGLAPVLSHVLDVLSADGSCLLARMSGSGATCFGLYAENQAVAAAARIEEAHPDWWVAAARLRTEGDFQGTKDDA